MLKESMYWQAWVEILLARIEEGEGAQHSLLLDSVEAGLRSKVAMTDEMLLGADSISDELKELLWEECSDGLEGHLGLMFLVYQTEMESVWGNSVSLFRACECRPAFKRERIFELGPLVRGRSCTYALAIWELGNYFKHRDTWRSWNQERTRNQTTIKLLETLGCEERSAGNFRHAGSVLGMRWTATRLESVRLDKRVAAWRRELGRLLRLELGLRRAPTRSLRTSRAPRAGK